MSSQHLTTEAETMVLRALRGAAHGALESPAGPNGWPRESLLLLAVAAILHALEKGDIPGARRVLDSLESAALPKS